MPSKSKSQQRLMSWAYACKTGKAKKCPDNIKRLSDEMTTKQLKDFTQLEEDGAPVDGMATVDNTPGMGPVSLPGPTINGSGDRFDNGSIDTDKKKKKKRVKSFEEFIYKMEIK